MNQHLSVKINAHLKKHTKITNKLYTDDNSRSCDIHEWWSTFSNAFFLQNQYCKLGTSPSSFCCKLHVFCLWSDSKLFFHTHREMYENVVFSFMFALVYPILNWFSGISWDSVLYWFSDISWDWESINIIYNN